MQSGHRIILILSSSRGRGIPRQVPWWGWLVPIKKKLSTIGRTFELLFFMLCSGSLSLSSSSWWPAWTWKAVGYMVHTGEKFIHEPLLMTHVGFCLFQLVHFRFHEAIESTKLLPATTTAWFRFNGKVQPKKTRVGWLRTFFRGFLNGSRDCSMNAHYLSSRTRRVTFCDRYEKNQGWKGRGEGYTIICVMMVVKSRESK